MDSQTGFSIGAGIPFDSQFIAAFQFYNDVLAAGADPNTVTLTGHSLGGGLAGVVAAIHGKTADLFANMAFESAANEAYQYMLRANQPLDPDPNAPYSNSNMHYLAGEARTLIYGSAEPWSPTIGSNLHSYHASGEFLYANRLMQSTPDDALDPGTSDLIGLEPFFERHSMRLHTLLLWEKENTTEGQTWKEVSDHLWNSYSMDAIGTASGFVKAPGFTSEPGAILATAIAYSVIDEGTRPFGDTAVKALFDDASDLGFAVRQDSSILLKDDVIQGDITNLIVNYAGLLAKNAVLVTARPATVNGFITLDRQAGALQLDLSDAMWTVGDSISDPYARDAFINHIVSHIATSGELQQALSWYAAASVSQRAGTDLIGSVTLDLEGPNELVTATDIYSGQLDLITSIRGVNARVRLDSDDFLLRTNANETLSGGDGTDVLFGGNGGDLLEGDSGNDYLLGGDGDDDLRDGNDNDFLMPGGGINVLSGGLSADVFWFDKQTGHGVTGENLWSELPGIKYDVFDADVMNAIFCNGYKITGGDLI